MTVYKNLSHAQASPARVRQILLPVAVGATLFAVAFNALGVYGDGAGSETRSTGEFLAVSGISVVAVAVVFGLVLPRALRKDGAGGVALTLAILGALSLVAFWAGITPALAVGGILLGFAGRDSAKGSGRANAAFVVGLLVSAGYAAIYILDWMSTNGIG